MSKPLEQQERQEPVSPVLEGQRQVAAELWRPENMRTPDTPKPPAEQTTVLDFGNHQQLYDSDIVAYRPTQLEPVKPAPEARPENERVSVENLLGMVSDIGPASKQSDTLKELLGEMRQHPWKIGAIFEHPVKFPDYNPKDNSIHIDSALSKQKQVDTFGHELYHGTHQNLDDLYADGDPVGLDRYKQIKMDQESCAFLAEFKVNKELKHTEPMTFDYVQNNEIHKQRIADLISYKSDGTIDDTKSKQAITDFLSTHRPPRHNEKGEVERDWLGNIQTNFYPETHEKGYHDNYLPNFKQNRDTLLKEGWLGKGY